MLWPELQRESGNSFTDEINHSDITKHIIHGRPNTLPATLDLAKEEQLTTKTFNLHCCEEPMDVNLAELKMRYIHLSHDHVHTTPALCQFSVMGKK